MVTLRSKNLSQSSPLIMFKSLYVYVNGANTTPIGTMA